MKILRIRLTNLNSLQGSHIVDLTEEPLASAGLFAITGPTGAGKSTLLDAITLALFGRAARYGNESNPEHVMSRHCGECSAEVEFEVRSGVYRARWERRRARGKATGALQPPTRHIYDADGQSLAQQIREAESKIEEIIGLNYERFLRSALLAQGEFARFLKAKADERAELLESLTGTAVYSALGQKAYEEAKRREDAIEIKEAGLRQIPVLPDPERAELEAQSERETSRRSQLEKEIQDGAKIEAGIRDFQAARGEEKSASAALKAIEEDRSRSLADLERLRRHQLTLPFSDDLTRLDLAETGWKSATQKRQQAEAKDKTSTEASGKANAILHASVRKALAILENDVRDQTANADKQGKIAAEARAWLDDHRSDAVLSDQVIDLVTAIGDLQKARSDFGGAWDAWKSAAIGILAPEDCAPLEGVESRDKAHFAGALDTVLVAARKTNDLLEKDLEEAKRQAALRDDHLKKAMLVAKLADHRHALISGEPCPLCGALEHPFATGSEPDAGLAELEQELKGAKKRSEDFQRRLDRFHKSLEGLESQRGGMVEKILARSELTVVLENMLHPLALNVPAPGEEAGLRAQLQNREKEYRNRAGILRDAEAEAKKAQDSIQSAAAKVVDLQNRLDGLPACAGIVSIPPAKLPGPEEAAKAFSGAESKAKTDAALLADAVSEERSASTALENLRHTLQAAVSKSEFETLENLRSARLAPDLAKRLETLRAALDKRKVEADGLLKTAEGKISKLQELSIPEGDQAEAFLATQGQRRSERDEILQRHAKLSKHLEDDRKNRQARDAFGKELEEERKELGVWRRLRELIGSHDGAKFRRFAQSISLEILTRLANRHLHKLSDRYRICGDESDDLHLQIEDMHQAAVKRPMASLSGGESFLVSLALALGLSDLAGQSVRIDSLFIDEGFGSLDPESLEIAISALESLRQNNKTVGVISHIDLLKERISTQVVVEKLAGGRSRIRIAG